MRSDTGSSTRSPPPSAAIPDAARHPRRAAVGRAIRPRPRRAAARPRARPPDQLLDALVRGALRPLAVQRASAILRLHHRAAGADRRARRTSGRRGQRERRELAPVAGRHRDRGARRFAGSPTLIGYPVRMRRTAGQRRQHGELRRLPCRARGAAPLERSRRRRRGRAAWSRTAPPRRTPGFRRPPTSPGSAPTPSAGSQRTAINA